MTHAAAGNVEPVQGPETIFGLVVSLLFWLCLISSALLFGAVGLSPKFLTYLQLRGQFESNQAQLALLEQQADRMQQVVDAIKRDKEFAAELTRTEFDAARPGEESIPVANDLKLDAKSYLKTIEVSKPTTVWYLPFVQYLASDRSLRTSLLWAAGLLVVVSFWVLQPANLDSSDDRHGGNVWKNLRNRYIQHAK